MGLAAAGWLSHSESKRRLAATSNPNTNRRMTIEDENRELRVMLAIAHAGLSLYTDDGELQDNRCHPWIDFKRDSVAQIEEKLHRRHLHQTTPCKLPINTSGAECSTAWIAAESAHKQSRMGQEKPSTPERTCAKARRNASVRERKPTHIATSRRAPMGLTMIKRHDA